MLRKLVSGIITLTLAAVGLTLASSAQAAGSFSVKASLPYYAANSPTFIPISDESTLLIGQQSESGISQLKSGILHSDGTFDSEAEIAQLPNNSYFHNSQSGSWLITKDGVIAFAWFISERDSATHIVTSYSYISFSENGKEWSSPNQLFAPKIISENQCFMFFDCGYQSIEISQDIYGTFTAVTTAVVGQKSTLEASSSRDGVIWSAPTLLDTGAGSNFAAYKLSEMPAGGFMVAWSIYVGNNNYVDRFSTMPPKLGFWNKAKDFGTIPWSNSQPVIAQTDPTALSLFYLSNEGNVPQVNQRKYNLMTKTWGDAVAIITMPQGWISGELQFSMGNNWHGAIAAGGVLNGILEAHAYVVELNASVASPQTVFANSTEQALSVTAIRVNFDDSVTLVTAGYDRASRIFKLRGGVEQEVEQIPWTLTTQIYSQSAAFSPSGNISMVSAGQNDVREGMFLNLATRPVASGAVRVSGTAKSGSQLLATLPTFSGISAIGKTSIQWYSCSNKVATVQTSIPLKCVAIPKATSNKFKVTSKQKKKYLGVSVTNTNAIGTTLMFSPTTTAKIK